MNFELIYITEKLIGAINYIVTIKEHLNFYKVEIRHPVSYYGYFLRYYKTQFSHLKGAALHNALIDDAIEKARLM